MAAVFAHSCVEHTVCLGSQQRSAVHSRVTPHSFLSCLAADCFTHVTMHLLPFDQVNLVARQPCTNTCMLHTNTCSILWLNNMCRRSTSMFCSVLFRMRVLRQLLTLVVKRSPLSVVYGRKCTHGITGACADVRAEQSKRGVPKWDLLKQDAAVPLAGQIQLPRLVKPLRSHYGVLAICRCQWRAGLNLSVTRHTFVGAARCSLCHLHWCKHAHCTYIGAIVDLAK